MEGRILTLLYHRINTKYDSVFNLSVNPKDFRNHIKYIKNNYNVVRFEDDWSLVDQNSICITFDDGYADNFLFALPILEEFKVPATVFVTTGYIGSKEEYWWDEMGRILTTLDCYPKSFRLNDSLYNYEWNTEDISGRIDMLKSLHWILKLDKDILKVDTVIEQLRNWSGINKNGRQDNLPMSIVQLKRISESQYITIGGHTIRHRSLGARTYNEQDMEITESVKFLRRTTGKRITTFSYPFGSKFHYNNDTIEICKKNGIIKAASTNKGVWKKGDGLYDIPRISIGDMNLFDFKRIVESYYNE